MSKRFNTRPVLNTITEGLTLIAMAGLTFASAATLATPTVDVPQVVHQLPTVEITVKKHQLPTVIVTAKRSQIA